MVCNHAATKLTRWRSTVRARSGLPYPLDSIGSGRNSLRNFGRTRHHSSPIAKGSRPLPQMRGKHPKARAAAPKASGCIPGGTRRACGRNRESRRREAAGRSWETRGGSSAGGNKNGWGASSWMSGGARPQTAEIIKTLNQRCPEITVTNNTEKADFVLVLDHEGGRLPATSQQDRGVCL